MSSQQQYYNEVMAEAVRLLGVTSVLDLTVDGATFDVVSQYQAYGADDEPVTPQEVAATLVADEVIR